MSEDVLFRGVSGAGQRFVAGVDPGLRGLDGAGDQKDGVLARVVLPVDRHTSGLQIYVIKIKMMIGRKYLSHVALHFKKLEVKMIVFQQIISTNMSNWLGFINKG